MIRIQYCNLTYTEKCHWEYVKKRIHKNAKNMSLNTNNKKTETSIEWEILLELRRKIFAKSKNTNETIENEEETIHKIATCSELEFLVQLQEKWYQLFDEENRALLSSALGTLLGYDDFYNGLEISVANEKICWNRHTLMQSVNTSICPYCGRQYITNRKNDTTTASCDHYYPKSQYPLLSINMYNLVPSCYVCNSVIKGNRLKRADQLHLYPYQDDSNLLKFRIKIDNADSLYNVSKGDNLIEVEIGEACCESQMQRAKSSVELFELQDVYQHHQIDAFELRRALREEASEAYQKIFNANFEQLKAINKFAFSYRRKELTQEPLVKFCRDIEEQFVEKNSL